MNLHNILILESMCVAGLLISTGSGLLAMVGIAWNAIVLVANLTGDKKQTGDTYNTIIIERGTHGRTDN